jgi:5-methylcytosine-specific restriction protein A
MPHKPLSPCSVPGCPNLAIQWGRCAAHAQRIQQQYGRDRGTVTEQGYGWAWQQKRAAWLRANPYCVACGAVANTVDHIVPLRQGGPDDESNYQSMCKRCHDSKRQREGMAARVSGTGPAGQPYETEALKRGERR